MYIHVHSTTEHKTKQEDKLYNSLKEPQQVIPKEFIRSYM